DPLDAVARGVQPALLALQLAGKLGDAAVGVVELALCVLARLLGGEQALATAGERVFQLDLAGLQLLDALAQALDLAFAQQRALARRARTQHPQPAGAET